MQLIMTCKCKLIEKCYNMPYCKVYLLAPCSKKISVAFTLCLYRGVWNDFRKFSTIAQIIDLLILVKANPNTLLRVILFFKTSGIVGSKNEYNVMGDLGGLNRKGKFLLFYLSLQNYLLKFWSVKSIQVIE